MIFITLAAGLLLAVVLIRIGVARPTAQIRKLLEGIRKIEEGRYGYKVEDKSRGEIGELIAGFNRMSDKLGELDKLKEDFLSVISHELFTPVTPIAYAAEQLKADPDLPESARPLISIIEKQTKKLQNLLEEVMDFSWMEIKEWELKREPVSLEALCEHALDTASDLAEAKSIDLRIKLGENLYTILIDKKRIQHVLRILLDNAIKFTPERGKVILEVRRVSGGVEFIVEDTGIGLARQNIGSIFTSFYQVEDQLTRTKGGMGIGLAIAKKIVEAHNGSIWAESPGLGEGSRFIFLLPIA